MASTPNLKNGVDIAKGLAEHIRGKTILITGGTLGGVGAECAATLVQFDPKLVILTARTQAKYDETAASILKQTPGAALRPLILELSTFAGVRKAAEEVNSWPEVVDVLIHNAAVATPAFQRTEDGLEYASASNHFGPFLLTKLLMPKMLTAPSPPRVVIVSSGAHRMCKGIRWHDPQYLKEDEYGEGIYGETKTYNILFAAALARRSGGKVEAFSLSPGWIYTGLSRYLSPERLLALGFVDETGRVKHEQFATLQNGVAPYIRAAFDPELKSANGGFVGADTELNPGRVADHAKGQEVEDRMWNLSEQTVKEKFTF